jgi:hypothetical protein
MCLGLVPQRLIDDRGMLARMMTVLVDDFAEVDAVLQHQIERAAGQRPAAPLTAAGA